MTPKIARIFSKVQEYSFDIKYIAFAESESNPISRYSDVPTAKQTKIQILSIHISNPQLENSKEIDVILKFKRIIDLQNSHFFRPNVQTFVTGEKV